MKSRIAVPREERPAPHGPVKRIVGRSALKPFKEAAQEHEQRLKKKAARDLRDAKTRLASRRR
jgi:hypothetical protein